MTFFAETKGVPAEFAFDADVTTTAAKAQHDGITIVTPKSGTGVAIEVRNHVLVLLDAETARDCYKATWLGKERVFLSRAVVVPDGDALRLLASGFASPDVRMVPAPEKLKAGEQEIVGQDDGVFRHFVVPAPVHKPQPAGVEQIKPAGAPREVPMGKGKKPVAVAPSDADFAEAAVWRVNLPGGLDRSRDYVLRVHYKGDVIRACLGDQFLTDDFYNGNTFELGLKRFAPAMFDKELLLRILPLRKDAPIFLADRARPDFRDQEAIATIDSVEVIERPETRLVAP